MKKTILGLGLTALLGCNEPALKINDNFRMNELLPSPEYVSAKSSYYLLENKKEWEHNRVFGDFNVTTILEKYPYSPDSSSIYYRFSHKEDYKLMEGYPIHQGQLSPDYPYQGIFFQLDSGPIHMLNRREKLNEPQEGIINDNWSKQMVKNQEVSVLRRKLLMVTPSLLQGKQLEPDQEFVETYQSLKANSERYVEEYRKK